MTHADLVRSLVLGRNGPAIYRKLATAAIAEKAGRLPERIADAPPAAPPDAAPVVSPGASRILGAIETAFPDVLPEWLARCAVAGRRAREKDLPLLLERGRTTTRLRPAIAAVIGARGRWLAGENPSWAWATKIAEPPAADEATLEAALDDRRKETRRAAAARLAAMPGSRLSERMIARVRACLRGGQVKYPAACDAAMVRDGIEPTPPKGVGAKAYWLFQMLSLVPPSVVPEKLLVSEPLFLSAGSRAALLHRDVDAAERLLRRAAAGDEGADLALLEVLPPDRRHRLLHEMLRAQEPDALTVLMRAPPTLPPELSRAALAALARARYRGRLLHQLALRIDPVVDPAFQALVVDQLPLLELRQRLHREISREAINSR